MANMSPPGGMSMPFRSWRTRNKSGEPDADVTPDELKQYVRAVAGTPFSVAALQSGNRVQADLFPKLDRNSDDVLDTEELEAARSTLQSFDIDDDEMISLTELRSDGGSPYFRYQVRGSATNDRASKIVSSFVVIDTERPIAALQKLLQKYDTFVRDKTSGARLKDSRLSRSELNMNEALFKKFDTNADETLAKDELIALLHDPQPDVEIAVELKLGENDKATIRLLSSPGSFAEGGIVVRPDSDRSMRLAINKLKTIVKPDLDDASAPNFAQNYTARFKGADMDNNEYLDRNEIRFIGIASRDFGRMDADRDGKVFLKEITAYIDDVVKLGKSLIALVVSDDNVTPFQLLDVNNDEIDRNRIRSRPKRKSHPNGSQRWIATATATCLGVSFLVRNSYSANWIWIPTVCSTPRKPLLGNERIPKNRSRDSADRFRRALVAQRVIRSALSGTSRAPASAMGSSRHFDKPPSWSASAR